LASFVKSLNAVVAFLPFSVLFNAVAAVVSIADGFLVYEALIKRAPALVANLKARSTRPKR
jgi:hypothetical protein